METAIKERSIIFSGPMVRAILAGKKTQTRRAVKPQPITDVMVKSRFAVGDRLWVRETWQVTDETISDQPGVVYRATDPDWEVMEGWKWCSPIFMPRWASRLTLETTDVREQRVQEISSADCVAEGLEPTMRTETPIKQRFQDLWDSINAARGFGWRTNPWVWAITFKVVR